MSKFRLRSRFLIVRLLIAAGLTAAVILIVRYSFGQQADEQISAELQRCREQFQALQGQIGTEIGPRLAAQVGAICGCDVAFASGTGIVASTMNPARDQELATKLAASGRQTNGILSIQLGNEPFRVLVFPVSAKPPFSEIVLLRSLASANAQRSEFMRLMVILAVTAMIIGFFLVLRVSDTFARPFGNLVEAVKALEKGDFSYPVKVGSHDELAEVTQAFDQMRSSLQETQQQLIRSERLATIGQMASSISHDLRHPLTAIVANSEFLCEEQPTAEQRQGFYQEIRVAVDQMNDLVESLLEFSRGRESPRIVAVNLDEVVERVVRSVASRAEFHGIEIQVECPHSFECLVDPLKVERAVGNLLINACEAVVTEEAGQVEVRVSAANGTTEIRVADNGPGVADAIRGAIFQPFVSHGKANGTGLGLAVVQKICRDHGGDAALESSIAGRTVFKMTLPRVP